MLNFRKKLWCCLLLLVMLVLAGCGNNISNHAESLGSKKKATVKLTFFGNKADESNVRVMEQILASFMEEHPNVVITYESIKGNAYYTMLEKRMAKSSGDDIFLVNHDMMLKLKQNKQLANLSDIATINNYSSQIKNQFMDADGIYWLPTTVSAFGMYCNMDLLKEHGQKVPTNIKELREVCDYFVSKGITPLVVNNDISLKTAMIGAAVYDVEQFGEMDELIEKLNGGSVQLGSTLEPGIKLVQEMVQKKYVDAPTALHTVKTKDDLKSFAKGKNPFMLTGVWVSNHFKNDFKPRFRFEVHPLPVLSDGAIVPINPDIRICINAKSKHIKEAKEFIEFFTQPENIHDFSEEQCSISPFANKFPTKIKEIEPVIKAYTDGRLVMVTHSSLKLPIWNITMNASQALLKGESESAVCEQVNKEAARFVNK